MLGVYPEQSLRKMKNENRIKPDLTFNLWAFNCGNFVLDVVVAVVFMVTLQPCAILEKHIVG